MERDIAFIHLFLPSNSHDKTCHWELRTQCTSHLGVAGTELLKPSALSPTVCTSKEIGGRKVSWVGLAQVA